MSCADLRIVDRNYLFDPTVGLTASSESSNFPVSNLRKFFRSKVWRTTGVEESLVIDLRSAEEVDCFAMVFDPTLSNRFSSDATFRLQASATNVWSSTPVDVTLTMDEDSECLTHYFEEAVEYRYWKISITDEFNPDEFLEIPKIILGKSLAITKLPQAGFQFTLKDPSLRQKTVYGHEYVDVLPIQKALGFSLNYVPVDQAELLWKSYYRTGIANPVLVILDSQEALFDKDRMTIYGKYASDIQAAHALRNLFGFDLVIEETL
jgi:hypothetical protein